MNTPPFPIDLTTDALIKQMQSCTSWEDKYRLIVQLSKKMPSMDEETKTKAIEVTGCETPVWLHWQKKNDQYHFQADSSARLVKGLLAIILVATEGKTKAELLAFNFDDYFAQLNLLEHLSQSRSNGIQAIIQQIKLIAES